MNASEVAQLLAVIVAYDRRTVGDTDVISWHEAVGDLHFEECRDAVVLHYRTSKEWLMPVDVRRLVTAARNDRAMRALPSGSDDRVPMPDWFKSTVEGHRRRAKAEREAADYAGEPVTFGEAIVTASDRMRRSPEGSW